jgi:hypothetical protein
VQRGRRSGHHRKTQTHKKSAQTAIHLTVATDVDPRLWESQARRRPADPVVTFAGGATTVSGGPAAIGPGLPAHPAKHLLRSPFRNKDWHARIYWQMPGPRDETTQVPLQQVVELTDPPAPVVVPGGPPVPPALDDEHAPPLGTQLWQYGQFS